MSMIAWVVCVLATCTANILRPTTRATVTTASIGAQPSGTIPICTIASRTSSRTVLRSLSKTAITRTAYQGSLLLKIIPVYMQKSLSRAQGHTLMSLMGTRLTFTYISINPTRTITHIMKMVAPLKSLLMCTSRQVSQRPSTLQANKLEHTTSCM